jgi:hypothetical protein
MSANYNVIKKQAIDLAKIHNFKLDSYKVDYMQDIINKYNNVIVES